MTLTEFLLARIAEEMPEPFDNDEGVAYAYSAYRHAGSCDLVQAAWGDPDCTCDGLPRQQAECEAKRRIVEDLRARTGQALAYLALPYADHPDYREEWRP